MGSVKPREQIEAASVHAGKGKIFIFFFSFGKGLAVKPAPPKPAAETETEGRGSHPVLLLAVLFYWFEADSVPVPALNGFNFLHLHDADWIE
jgi:hypothetical protein